MKYIPDKTGKFPQRIFFDDGELDTECDKIITNFLLAKYNSVKFPISTDDLISLIEKEMKLDVYAALQEGEEGKTDFKKDRPEISISEKLYADSKKQNRLRTTLAHEYGHAKFHFGLFSIKKAQKSLDLFDKESELTLTSYRKDNIETPKSDWIEWQANYISGAILIPINDLKPRLLKYLQQHDLSTGIYLNSPHARLLIQRVSERYEVSIDAARVRLQQLGYISDTPKTEVQGALL